MSQYQESQAQDSQGTPNNSQKHSSPFVPLTQRDKRSAPDSQQQSQKRTNKASLSASVAPVTAKSPKAEINVYEQMVIKAGEDVVDQVMDDNRQYNNDFTIDWSKTGKALNFGDKTIAETQREEPILALIKIRETKKLFSSLMYEYEAEQKADNSNDDDDDDNYNDDEQSELGEAKLRLDVAFLILMVYYGTCIARGQGGSNEIQVLIDQIVNDFDDESSKCEAHEFVTRYGSYLELIEGGIGEVVIFLLRTNATLVEKDDYMIRFKDFAKSGPAYMKNVKTLIKD
jgi:hypothetical protein